MTALAAPGATRPRLSVILPALEEEETVERAVRSVAEDADEVLVVDGGSRDATVASARAAGAHVLSAPRGRGAQLAAGARAAEGEWLLFLHADTTLEPGWREALQGAVRRGAVGGAFRFAVDAPGASFRVLERAVSLRVTLFGLPYGDQALFASRAAYVSCGGFSDHDLMEDVDFVRRLRRCGPLAFLEPRAFTSARRWQRHGLLRTSARNLGLLALYAAGLPPSQLARLYERGPSRERMEN